MNNSTSDEFEAWFKERFWHECYEDVKHHLFAAWQASRESLASGKEDDRQKAILEIGHILIDTRSLRSAEYHQAGLIFDAGYRLKVIP